MRAGASGEQNTPTDYHYNKVIINNANGRQKQRKPRETKATPPCTPSSTGHQQYHRRITTVSPAPPQQVYGHGMKITKYPTIAY
jgi:uncharacterized protein (DUF3084 family)